MAALSLESKRDPLRGAWPLIACEAYTLRCWYVTDGPMQEALIARDALESALHLPNAA
jgi:hypothetical protein